MGGREVTEMNCFFLQKYERSRSHREINQHPSLPWNFITHGFLDPSAFPDFSEPLVYVKPIASSLLKNPSPEPLRTLLGSVWTFSLTFGAIFPGGPKWHFSDFKMHYWGVEVPGLCRATERL